MDLLVFSGLMALGQMLPGPDWILVTRQALAGGRRAGLLTAAGITCGLAVHATLALAGLTSRSLLSGRIVGVIDCFFATYLVWIAIGIFRSRGASAAIEQGQVQIKRAFLKGILCNLMNVKVLVFFAAMSAAFVKPGSTVSWLVCLWLVMVVQGGLLWAIWASLLQAPSVVRRWKRLEAFLEYGFAAALVLMAFRLLVT